MEKFSSMEKQKQMIPAIGENFASSAAKIIDFIEDPEERDLGWFGVHSW